MLCLLAGGPRCWFEGASPRFLPQTQSHQDRCPEAHLKLTFTVSSSRPDCCQPTLPAESTVLKRRASAFSKGRSLPSPGAGWTRINRAPAKGANRAAGGPWPERQVSIGRENLSSAELLWSWPPESDRAGKALSPARGTVGDRFLNAMWRHRLSGWRLEASDTAIWRAGEAQGVHAANRRHAQPGRRHYGGAARSAAGCLMAEPWRISDSLIMATRRPRAIQPANCAEWLQLAPAALSNHKRLDARCARAHAWMARARFCQPGDVARLSC